MKHLTVFYQKHCPYCIRAFNYIEELKKEYPELASLDIETIDEIQEPDIANRFDYYYVPTFYLDGKKIHEGAIAKPDVEKILLEAIK